MAQTDTSSATGPHPGSDSHVTSPESDLKPGPDLPPPQQDEFRWLEEVHGERPMTWVREQNARTETLLDSPELERLQQELVEALEAPDRIPYVTKRGDWYYNLWRDAEHPRGLWRRARWSDYLAGREASTDWEVLLDVDELAARDGTPWVFAGARLLRPDWDRALIRLSPDGGDAVVVREFDLPTRSFVPVSEGGFSIGTAWHPAKTRVSWIDRDRLLVGTVTDPEPATGDATRSSYARTQRVLSRPTDATDPLQHAENVFTVEADHVAAFGHHDSTPGWERTVAVDAVDFHHSTTWLRDPDADGERPGWRRLELPEDAELELHRQWLVVYLKSDWSVQGATHPSGSLLVCTLQGFLAGTAAPTPVFVPDRRTTLASYTFTASHLVLTLLQDVASRVVVLPQSVLGGPGAPDAARPVELASPNPADPYLTLAVSAVDDEDPECGDDVWITATGALTPPTLLRATLPALETPAGTPGPAAAVGIQPEVTEVRRAPERFEATGLTVHQYFATSADGTRVPYFQIGPRQLTPDGANPVLMDGYGGFMASKLPGYSSVYGRGWLARRTARGRTGVHVIASIRGGGEYGPDWHRAALRQNRHRAYEDFAAVAQDLTDRGVCDRAHLAATGRSNGGLLMGNMATRHPHLFGALSCGVPLLDMARYTVLSAGHSWIAEYGDPEDPEDWAFLRTFSPYHLLLETSATGATAGRDGDGPGTGYPDLLLWTATSDDRVGPVQARKMAARMLRLGVPNVWYHEDLDGGHAGASDNRQAAAMHARSLVLLWRSVTGTL